MTFDNGTPIDGSAGGQNTFKGLVIRSNVSPVHHGWHLEHPARRREMAAPAPPGDHGVLRPRRRGPRTELQRGLGPRTEKTLGGGTLDIRLGAPAGRYRVIYHPPSNGATMGLDVELAERVTVEPGGADIELHLPAIMPKGGGIPRTDE